jgi:hypothetical protein
VIRVGSRRRQVVRLDSLGWDLVGYFFGLAFERLKDCEDDLDFGESLAFEDRGQ